MTIDWQATLARLDADPDTNTPAGQAVLKGLLEAGRAYDSAGKPDVLYESAEHQRWTALLPSQRFGRIEPSFYEAAYYTRLAPRTSDSPLRKRSFSAEDLAVLPSDAKTAYAYWLPKDAATARQIASYYISKARDAELAALAEKSPTLGSIESALAAAVSAAESWLAQ